MATSKTTHVHTLILGGGITGLSTAFALEQLGIRDYIVLEKKKHLGGLCATSYQNGYHFDYGGHLLHLHTAEGKKLIKKLLGNNLSKHNRQAFIFTNGMHVPYPFQQNLWALKADLRSVCVEGLKRLSSSPKQPQNFEQWCIQSFGYGIYEAFFHPYNQKLWGRPLENLSCEWCGPFIPAPHRQQILQSAKQRPTASLGYNATFYYPKRGGIGALIEALAKSTPKIRTQAAVTHIDLSNKVAYINHGEIIHFEHLVNTIALPSFTRLLQNNIPLKRAAATLSAQPITVYHLAISRALAHFSWIYFPDRMQPFYRVGLQSGFDLGAVPNSNSSLLYIELPGLVPQTPMMERCIWEGLLQENLVMNEDKKLFSTWQTLEYAYVWFDQARAKAVPFLLDELKKKQVYCAGRYGRWEYSFMEQSLLEAQQLAWQLAKLI